MKEILLVFILLLVWACGVGLEKIHQDVKRIADIVEMSQKAAK
jgi:hypothetical protein